MEVAQATGVPPNGASNAFDFQPQTRNPQAEAIPAQPQTSNLQNPAASEVLGKQDLRIIVPTGNAGTTNSYSPTTKGDGAGDLFAIIVLGLVITAIISFLFQRRKKASRSRPVTAIKEETIAKPAPKKSKPAQKKPKPKHKRKKRK